MSRICFKIIHWGVGDVGGKDDIRWAMSRQLLKLVCECGYGWNCGCSVWLKFSLTKSLHKTLLLFLKDEALIYYYQLVFDFIDMVGYGRELGGRPHRACLRIVCGARERGVKDDSQASDFSELLMMVSLTDRVKSHRDGEGAGGSTRRGCVGRSWLGF